MNIILDHNRGYSSHVDIFLQALHQQVSAKPACQVDHGSATLTYQYPFSIDKYQIKSVFLVFEDRRSSYKVTLSANIPSKGLPGGLAGMLKIVQKLNSKVTNDFTSYAYSEPNVFSAKVIVEKQTLLFLDIPARTTYCRQLVRSTIQCFECSLLKIGLMQYQESTCFKKVKDVMELINTAKLHFDSQIRKRSRQVLQEEKFYRFTDTQCPNVKVTEEEAKVIKEEQIGKLYAVLRRIDEQIKKKNREGEGKFLGCKIKVTHHEIDEDWKAPEGSFGKLEKVKAEYLILQSFNKESADFITQQAFYRQQKQTKTLIHKQMPNVANCQSCFNNNDPNCQCYLALKSFSTQIQIVSFIRNIVAESVARYFLEDNKQNSDCIQNLYLKYYPHSLVEEDISAKQLMGFLISLLQGIKILSETDVIHRDLKPGNILLDQRRVPKIIDFGSAYELKDNIPKERIHQRLVTTKKYNLFYSEAQFANKRAMTVQEFQRHHLFDLHAFGIILRELYSSPQVSSDLGNMVITNLSWLSVKCSQHNPDLRLNYDEALSFCNLLLKMTNTKLSYYC